MAMAWLGFANGPSVAFRIDPEDIKWEFKVNTKVFDTIGGRVVQVLGGSLSDIKIMGKYGEDRSKKDGGGQSWKLQKAFVEKIRELMEYQSRDAQMHYEFNKRMHPPARFVYPPRDWDFQVYVKSIQDPMGGSAHLSTGKYSHDYILTLFIVEANTATVRRVSDKAVNDYIARISDGIGWRYSEYNGVGTENVDPYSDQWGVAIDEFREQLDPIADRIPGQTPRNISGR